MRWADIPGPFPGNASVNMFSCVPSRFLIMQQLDYNNGRTVFSTWSVPRGYKRDEVWNLVQLGFSSVLESLKRGLEPGGRGIVIVGAVARKRLITLRTLDCVL
jgi:hypothetical protein